MSNTLRAGCAAMILSLPAAAAPLTVVEDFEGIGPGDHPTAGWTFGGANSVRQNGNNHYLFADVDTCCLVLRTTLDGGSPFVGDRDYRAFGVIGLRIRTGGTTDFPNAIRPVGIALMQDSGTPGDPSDDYGFYTMTGDEYAFDGSVQTFDFPIPVDHSGSNPPGWLGRSGGPNAPFGVTWDDVVTSVDQIQILYHDPTLFYIFQFHHVGVDDITIAYAP